MEIAAPANHASLQDQARQLLRQAASWFGLAATDQMLPRKHCHFTTVALKGVPRRHAESALRLRLQQLGLFDETGFAWSLLGETAHVWYWDDRHARALFPAGRIAPWPEPLWRHTLQEGVRLVACSDGYELEGRSQQGVYRSRWFAQRPGSADIEAFCRDLGISGTVDSKLATNAQSSRPNSAWRISSLLAPAISFYVWLATALIVISGLIAVTETAQLIRLKQEHTALKTESAQLRAQSSKLLTLESELKTMAPTLDTLRDYLEAPRQTRWLADMARQDVIGSLHDVYVADWTYSGNRITTTLVIGPKARSADVIARLERSGLFSDISLIPDPPANTIRLLLKLPEDAGAAGGAPSGSTYKP